MCEQLNNGSKCLKIFYILYLYFINIRGIRNTEIIKYLIIFSKLYFFYSVLLIYLYTTKCVCVCYIFRSASRQF